MNKKIGFIGCGNMASAMMGGIINSGAVQRTDIVASDPIMEKREETVKKFGVTVTESNSEAAAADILVIAVQPQQHEAVLQEIKGVVGDKTIIVTIAAGIELQYVEKQLGRKAKVIRTMPNTPMLVGHGLIAMCCSGEVTGEELQQVKALFESVGRVELIEEEMMDMVPAVSGSSPAYVFMFIEALADGGVLSGFPRDKAYKMAAQAVLGAASMVLATGKHPGELKDMVCTPGGLTIEAVAELEAKGLRDAVISAVRSCNRKALELKESGK